MTTDEERPVDEWAPGDVAAQGNRLGRPSVVEIFLPTPEETNAV